VNRIPIGINPDVLDRMVRDSSDIASFEEAMEVWAVSYKDIAKDLRGYSYLCRHFDERGLSVLSERLCRETSIIHLRGNTSFVDCL